MGAFLKKITGLFSMKLSRKLPLLFTLLGLISGGVIGYLADQEAEHEAFHEIEIKLDALAELKEIELLKSLKSIQSDLRFNAVNPFVLGAQRDFIYAWNELGAQGVSQKSFLQKWYIDDNPNPTGSKEVLDYAEDGSSYSAVHKKYHPWFREFLKERGYYDIFLFDTRGNLVYSVFKKLDYATNLNNGEWKDTDLGNAFRAGINSAKGEHVFFDFKPYAPSNGAPASFISEPLVDDGGSVVGVLVYQMPVDSIDSIMGDTVGLGETGEASLYGEDYLMRNKSKFAKDGETTILQRKFENQYIKLAFEQGNKIHSVSPDYKGQDSLMSYIPFEFLGIKYVVVASESMEEVMIPILKLRKKIAIEVAVIIILVTIFGVIFGRNISSRIAAMANAMGKMAEGKNATIPDLEHTDEIGDIARALRGINEIGQAAIRVQTSLDNVKGNVMIADGDNNIIYLNNAVSKMMLGAEADIKKDLPNFDASTLVGTNIDDFHKNPEHQRGMLGALKDTYETTIQVGGRTFDLVANPVNNAEGERLGTVVEWMDVTQERAIESEINGLVQAAASGNFSRRISEDGKEGFFLNFSKGINQINSVSEEGLTDVIRVLNDLSKGNLTQRIDSDYEGMFNDIKVALNGTIDTLLKMVGNIKESANSVNSASSEISSGSTDLSHRTEAQASSLEETAASMEQLTGTVRQNTENAQQANKLSGGASDIATRGGEVVHDAVEAMGKIQDSSQKIADIIGVIDDIAFQTNLLALNAAVEAARAGEAGKGFAVVAAEVRTLAGRSASAAKEIRGLINESVDQVKDGSELVNKAGETLGEIVASVKEVATLVADIASASEEQASGIDEINSAVTQMDEGTQQNAALVEENTAAAQSLVDQAGQLQEMMVFFTIDDEADGAFGGGGAEPLALASPSSSNTSAPTEIASSSAKKSSGAAKSYDEGWEEF